LDTFAEVDERQKMESGKSEAVEVAASHRAVSVGVRCLYIQSSAVDKWELQRV